MTRRLGSGDIERGRARLALLTTVLLTVLLLLGISPGGSLTSVLAAVSGTPTSTSTTTNTPGNPATPVPSAGSPIQLVNPSKYSTTEIISNKSDSDTRYHLVAWVGNLGGPDPIVDFEVKTTGNNATTVFSTPGIRIGTSDTFQAEWPVAEANGNYTVHATLYSGATQISSDSEPVTVRKEAETVEMSYPVAGGTLGVYDPPGNAAGPGFVVDATASEDTEGVRVFYGTAPPGTEQNWRQCTTQVTVSYSNDRDRRIGCTVAAGVTAESITGVAALTAASDDFTPTPPSCLPQDLDPGPPPTCPTIDSGDAHRVFGYEQSPTSLAMNPSSASPVIGNCQELTATVTDSLGRPIWRAPVDVHAMGPGDNLQFGDTARAGNYQPPNQADTHDSNEPTSNCGGTGTPAQQSEHNRPGVAPDEKHIESIPATASGEGTDPSGGFIFNLRSASAGTTTVDAWSDTTEDDVRDGAEVAGAATLQWLSSTPSPTRSPSRSASATASTSPSSSPSTSTSASASAGPATRSITIEASRNTLVFGNRAVLSGIVDSPQSSCESGQTVRIHRAAIGGDFQEIGTATTAGDGTYSFETRPAESATYRATVDATSSCQGAISSDTAVRVRVRVKLRISDQTVRKGARVRLTGTVAPCGNHPGTDALLMRSFGGRFREIARKNLNARCKATFKVKVKRTASYKARWPSQDDNHESGASRERIVEVTRR